MRMPLYEYQCSKCEKVHEVMQKFSDPPMAECPECGASVRKLMSATSFALKGTGWYTTDYKRKSAAPAKAESAATEKSAPSAPSTSSGDSTGKPSGGGDSSK